MNLIYHYCSMDTFNLIMKNKTLRLSDISKSNDSSEKILIFRNLEKAMENAFLEMNFSTSPYDELDFGNYFEIITDNLKRRIQQESLVTCFSKAPDLLSQWRGYANDGCGFSIGFDRSLFEKYLKQDERFCVSSIEYDESKQIKMMKMNIMEGFLDCILRLGLQSELKVGKTDFRNLQSYFEDEYDDIAYDIATYLNETACLIKDYAFYEENEVRIVLDSKLSLCLENHDIIESKIKRTTMLQLGKIDYQIRNRSLVPFIDLKFEKAVKEGIIKEIIIGPKANVSIYELQIFLWNYGFDNINVKKSEISYR